MLQRLEKNWVHFRRFKLQFEGIPSFFLRDLMCEGERRSLRLSCFPIFDFELERSEIQSFWRLKALWKEKAGELSQNHDISWFFVMTEKNEELSWVGRGLSLENQSAVFIRWILKKLLQILSNQPKLIFASERFFLINVSLLFFL